MNIEAMIPIIIPLLVCVPLVIFGIKITIKQYRKETHGAVNSLVDAIQYDHEKSDIKGMIIDDYYKKRYDRFLEKQKTDPNRFFVLLRYCIYGFNILGVYMIHFYLIACIFSAITHFSLNFLHFTIPLLVISMGIILITCGNWADSKRVRHPFIYCVPRNKEELKEIDWFYFIPWTLLIVMGILYFIFV